VRFGLGAAWGHLRQTDDVSWPVEKILEEAFKLDPKDRALVVAELSSSEGISVPSCPKYSDDVHSGHQAQFA
jgi:hypothetical protein